MKRLRIYLNVIYLVIGAKLSSSERDDGGKKWVAKNRL